MKASTAQSQSPNKIPLWLKVCFTVYVSFHFYVNFKISGAWNLLWFCDIAVLVTLAGMWLENKLLVSMASVAILIPMLLWILDLLWRLALGRGHYLFGFAGYMFSHDRPWYVRAVSTFHLWLPLLLVWMLFKLGYDRRALLIQTVFFNHAASAVSRNQSRSTFTPEHPEANINWVYGTSDTAPQTAIPGWLYMSILVVFYPVVVYIPTHFALVYFFDRKKSEATDHATATTCLN